MEDSDVVDGDYIAQFAKRYGLDVIELRGCIACGPPFVRQYLADCGIFDAYPRNPQPPRSAARGENTEVKK